MVGNGTDPVTQSIDLTWDNATSTLFTWNVETVNVSATDFIGSVAGLTNISGTSIKTGIVDVNVGGTGKNTLTTTQILVGNGTDPITQSGNLTWTSGTNTLNVVGTATVITLGDRYKYWFQFFICNRNNHNSNSNSW